MKIVYLFCILIFLLTVVSAKKPKNTEEKSFKKVLKECQNNEATRVDAQILKKFRKQKSVNLPDNFGDHWLCVIKGVGYLNEDGTVNQPNLKKRITKKATADQNVDTILQQCSETKSNPKETAVHIGSCLIKNSVD